MAKILPFKAVVPNKEYIGKISTKSINTYSSDEVIKLHNNPYSFIHIVQPDINENPGTKGNTKERFTKVKNAFTAFVKKNYFDTLKKPALFLYEQTINNRSYIGFISGIATEEYENGIIKKHEQTLAKREEIFTEYLEICGFNAEPVLLTYPETNEINQLINKIKLTKHFLSFHSSDDNSNHCLWLIDKDEEQHNIIKAFENVPKVYIADGHHRSASSHRLSKQTNVKSILSFLISDKEIDIYDFNRIVKDLNGLSKTEFIDRLSNNFIFEEKSTDLEKPKKKHTFSLYIENTYYSLQIKPHVLVNKNASELLDAQLLTDLILSPILNIKDLKTDKRINFISGKHGVTPLKERVNSGKYKAGFCLYPVAYDELVKIADHDLTMPPKSTWIEPKLRTGLTIYQFDDE